MSDNSDIWFRRFCHGVLAVVVIVVFLVVCQSSYGQVAKVIVSTSRAQSCEPNLCVPGGTVKSYGSCVCIAQSDGRCYYLTAGHVIRGATSIHVSLNDGLHEATVLAATDEPDLALIAVGGCKGDPFPLYDGQVNKGTELDFVGFTQGGRYSLRKGALIGYRHDGYIDARITVDNGDSGGPLLLNNKTVGILSGYYTRDRYTSRSVGSDVCIAWLRSRGFDFGNQPQDRPSPVTPPGQPTHVTDDQGALLQLRSEIAELRVLIESGAIRGPQGPAGKDGRNGVDGKQGPPGKDGRDGVDGVTPDLRPIESRLSALESELSAMKNWKRRMLLVEDGNVIDDESYGINEPIVLDVKRFQRKSGE